MCEVETKPGVSFALSLQWGPRGAVSLGCADAVLTSEAILGFWPPGRWLSLQ